MTAPELDPIDGSLSVYVFAEAIARACLRPIPEVRHRAARPARVVAAEAAARRARHFCG